LVSASREDGIDCIIDRYVVVPPEGWPRWMHKQIRDSDFVVMVCTETYYQRVMGDEKPGKGLGARWEGHLIYQGIYSAFIPVLFESGNYAHIGEKRPLDCLISIPKQSFSVERDLRRLWAP
jgi:hypothetical protein